MKAEILELMQNAELNGYPCWNEHPDVVAGEIAAYTDVSYVSFKELVDIVTQIQQEHNA
jgi:hypothetical protein